MTTNLYLHKILSPLSEFGGIFNTSSIQDLHFKALPCYVICNLSESGTAGTHWIGIVLTKSRAMYFDSFGEKCSSTPIKALFARLGYHEYFYNFVQIQHNVSEKCGEYCLGFILCHKDGYDLHDYVSMFKTTNLMLNDKLLKLLLGKLTKKHLK